MTATISSVGYGDFKGRPSNDPHWEVEMLFLFFVMVVGIFLFSSITNEIFSYKSLASLRQIIRKEKLNMELFM